MEETLFITFIYSNAGAIINKILHYLTAEELASLCRVCKILQKFASEETLWKELAIVRWNELKLATQVDNWKELYRRKRKEQGLQYSDLSTEFRDCDWYACENNHLFLIGECRLPMIIGKCPECGSSIGGKHHQMLRNNSRLGSVRNIKMKKAVNKLEKNDILPFTSENHVNVLSEATEIDELDREKGEIEIPNHFLCPITLSVIKDPVDGNDGRTYERGAILEWLQTHNSSPMTLQPMTVEDLVPNNVTIPMWHKWEKKHKKALIRQGFYKNK